MPHKINDFRTDFDKPVKRNLTIARATEDEDDKDLIWLSISSERENEDWPGEFFILDHKPESIRMERLLTAGVGRDFHGGDQVCSVERVEIVDAKLRVGCRFCSGERSQEIKTDVLRNVRRNASIDAEIHKAQLVEIRNDGMEEVYRAIDWEPFGFAFTPYPADITVGVNRTAEKQPKPVKRTKNMSDENKTTPVDPNAVSLESLQAEALEKATKQVAEKLERAAKFESSAKATDAMLDLAEKHGCVSIAREAIKNGESLETFQTKLLDHMDKNIKDRTVGRQNPDATKTGMSDKDAKRFSITRACRLLIERRPLDGIEGEMSKEIEKKVGRGSTGLFIPAEVAETPLSRLSAGVQRHMMSRSTQVAGTFSLGGALVPTETLSMIELLRNMAVVMGLGARRLDDLQGDVTIPRQITATTIAAKGETETAAETNVTFDDIKLTPHRLTGFVPISKQLIAQSSEDVEALIREDLMKQLALQMDTEALYGTGADGQPVGLVNQTGINTITYGAAATWAKVVEHETTVEVDNALLGSLAYLTSPGAKGKWKTKSKDTGSGMFIWADNMVNGYPAVSSNQIPATGTYANRSIFANWSDMLIAFWSGMEIIVDPYSAKKTGKIEIQIEQLWDTALRHPESFSLSTDSAAQ
jgi:HK97 family phage major capsid protein